MNAGGQGETVAICAPNWLGDCIMCMPAVQAFAKRAPAAKLTALVKPKLLDLWRMHPAIGECIPLPPGIKGVLAAARALRRRRCSRAFVLPLSFRSALVPFLAGVKTRIGMAGHFRRWMLTEVIPCPAGSDSRHQCFEYMHVLGVPDSEYLKPELRPLPDALAAVSERLGGRGGRPLAVLMPGAARGPSKRWPSEYYARLARMLRDKLGCRLIVTGTTEERLLCKTVAAGAGEPEADWSGTPFPEYAALLSLAALAVANDSGGMHLACAMGAPTVAIYGCTSPEKTGPLAANAAVVRPEGVPGRRDIKRRSAAAESALKSITPQQVFGVARELFLMHNAAS